jgi:hypothetical protein
MQRVAMVRVDVREADGTVVRGPTRAVPWGEAAAFRLRSPVHEHAIDVQYGAAGSQLNLSYSRDGATTLERVIGQRQTVIRTESGALVTVRVVLTKVHLDAVPG